METQKNNMQRVLFRIRRATKAAIGLWMIILLCCPARNVFAAREASVFDKPGADPNLSGLCRDEKRCMNINV